MKTFVKKIIIYVCFVFCVAILFQILISLKIKDESINENDNLEQTSDINADLVFLGSSRCWVHFDPCFFDSTYKIKSVNIGVNGHSEISMAIIRLKYYLSRNKSPKFAILSFDPFVSAGSEINNANFFLKNEFARYSFFPNAEDLLFVNYFKFNFAEKYIPLYSIFKYKQLYNCISLKKNNSNGFNVNYIVDKSWDTISNPVLKSAKKHYFSKDQITSISNSLNELSNLCLKNNIKLLCIQTPVYKAIYDDVAFTNTNMICKNLGIPFLDINMDTISNNAYFFYNSNHLNKKGVDQMNQFLKKEALLTSFLKKNKY